MSETYTALDAEALGAAVAAVHRGELVVFPTDTVFGVAGRPDLPRTTAALFEAKRRPANLTLPVLVSALDEARDLAVFDRRAERLAEAMWPGGLTLILPRTARSSAWELGDERGTIGVRLPDHPAAAAILERTGALAATSANVSGRPTPGDCEGVKTELGAAVGVYVCAGPPPRGTPSTIVDLSGEEPRIIRAGELTEDRVIGLLG